MAVASLMYTPLLLTMDVAPTATLSRLISVSIALLLDPTLLPLVTAFKRSSLAKISTVAAIASDPLSRMLPLLEIRLTEPQGVLTSDWKIKLEELRSDCKRASMLPSVMSPTALMRTLPPSVDKVAPSIKVTAPAVACKSTVIAVPVAEMLPFWTTERPATTLVLPTVLVKFPPSVMSLVAPIALSNICPAACRSPVPDTVVMEPAAVVTTNAPPLTTSS